MTDSEANKLIDKWECDNVEVLVYVDNVCVGRTTIKKLKIKDFKI